MTCPPKFDLSLRAVLGRQIRQSSLGLALLLPLTAKSDLSPLADSPSPYVQAQATSRVHWHPWTEASLEKAKKAGKSVYVFIGSPLSELARETTSQIFGNEKTATWLNENFTCVFVDGDVQPEVAALGQHYSASVKQLAGQPIQLWLTPDELLPYEGANYLPPSEDWGQPGFLNTARSALDIWKLDPARAHALAAEAVDYMRLPALKLSSKVDVEAKLASASSAWVNAVDPVHGGFGLSPKLAEPEAIRFLLRRGETERAAALQAARAAVKGLLRDQDDGGFFRRCIDEAWKEPYPQKLLADQARIALALFEAAEVAKDPELRAAGIGALRFVLRDMRLPDGTFAAALDGTLGSATPPGGRPKYLPVGTARLAALASLANALQKSGEGDLAKEAASLTKRLLQDYLRPVGSSRLGSGSGPADLLALALAVKAQGDETGAKALIEEAKRAFFDATTGCFMAVPAELPSGFGLRVPALGEVPSAESLALMVGMDPQTADLLHRRLLVQTEYDSLPPGDVLLGLSTK